MAADRDDLSQLHQPVLVSEVLDTLRADRCTHLLDGTVGLGGHAQALLRAAPRASLIGLDRDADALAHAAVRLSAFEGRFRLIHSSYAALAALRRSHDWPLFDGILLDLGLSSLQLDDPNRGFSFRFDDAPLDMRFDTSTDRTAADLVNHASERDLADWLHRLGEEPRARAVARGIVKARPIRSVGRLRAVVARHALRVRRHDPATRTFQALRMAVNEEHEALVRGLPDAMDALAPGGRLAVLAFHSGEERAIKDAFRAAVRAQRGTILTKKPIRPTEAEVRKNPRARSARLRAFARHDQDPTP